MGEPMEKKPGAGAIVIVPAWDSCGSYEVFKGQLQTLAILGYETFVLAAPSRCMARKAYRDYRRTYRRLTANLDCTARDEVRLPFLPFGARRFRAVAAGRSAAFQSTRAAHVLELPRSLKRFLRGKRELFVLCNHYFNVPYVETLQKLLRTKLMFALETHDIQSRHLRQHAAGGDDDYEALLADELAFVAKADRAIHINAEEHRVFKAALPEAAHRLIYPAIAERPLTTAARADTTFLIVAAANTPNAESIEWFLTKVWSRYEGHGGLRIVGGVAYIMAWLYPETFRRWQVVFAGRAEDLGWHYAGAAVVVVPVIAGEGISIKFAEAMAYGKQVLFTPRAVRGLPDHCVDHVRDGLCEDEAALLEKLEAVPADAGVTVSKESLRVYRTLFAREKHVTAYEEIVRATTNAIGSR